MPPPRAPCPSLDRPVAGRVRQAQRRARRQGAQLEAPAKATPGLEHDHGARMDGRHKLTLMGA